MNLGILLKKTKRFNFLNCSPTDKKGNNYSTFYIAPANFNYDV